MILTIGKVIGLGMESWFLSQPGAHIDEAHMLIQGHRPETVVGEQGKMISAAVRWRICSSNGAKNGQIIRSASPLGAPGRWGLSPGKRK